MTWQELGAFEALGFHGKLHTKGEAESSARRLERYLAHIFKIRSLLQRIPSAVSMMQLPGAIQRER